MAKDINMCCEKDKKTPAQEQFDVEYPALGTLIGHFSTLRSTLTTFCLTASLTAFSAHFVAKPFVEDSFTYLAGWIMLVAGSAVCLVFSWRTEKALLKYKRLKNWRWPVATGDSGCCWQRFTKCISERLKGMFGLTTKTAQSQDPKVYPLPEGWLCCHEIVWKMSKDPMNWVMGIGVGFILAFALSAQHKAVEDAKKHKDVNGKPDSSAANAHVPTINYGSLVITNLTIKDAGFNNFTPTNKEFINHEPSPKKFVNYRPINTPFSNHVPSPKKFENYKPVTVPTNTSTAPANAAPGQSNRAFNLNILSIQVPRGPQQGK